MNNESITPLAFPSGIKERQQIGHITLEIREIVPDAYYVVYSYAPRQAETRIDSAGSIDEARQVLNAELQTITARIEKRRKGKPTPAQVYTLFSLMVPIPVTLTWGQASDMISAALAEKQNERRMKSHLASVRQKGIAR